MNFNETKLNKEARRFFLGSMSEEERAAFESSFIEDEAAFDNVRAIEDELVEQYVRDILPAAERELFTSNYLVSAANRERVDLTRTMLRKFAADRDAGKALGENKHSIAHSIIAFFAGNRLAFGSAFALLLIIAAGLFFFSSRSVNDVARNEFPTPEIRSTIQIPTATPIITAENENGVGSRSSTPTPTLSPRSDNRPPEKSPETPRTSVPVLALFAGSVRSGGNMAQLDLPKAASGARLQLNVESSDYKLYRAEVIDPDGRVVFRTANISANSKKVEFFVAATRLKNSEYSIRLLGVNRNNTIDSFADYSFRVVKK